MRLLITGGAGFIGGHVSHLLAQKGIAIEIYDNLSTGKEKNLVKSVPFHRNDLADYEALSSCLSQGNFDGIIHLAASINPVESIKDPQKYYHNNTVNTLTLLDCCRKAGVNNIIYSSTAAVYGVSDHVVVDEEALLYPLSPYGMSKLMSENIIKDYATAYGMKYVTLRYFNVVGVDPHFNVGYSDISQNLIKVVCDVALKRRPFLPIYGSTYPTKDGTAVRDYIHPTDLALAHYLAADYLINKEGESTTLNCGYGEGYSILDVVKAIEHITGEKLKTQFEEKRQGDPIALVADTKKINSIFKWEHTFNDIEKIVKSSLEWQRKN